ncbi:MAG: YdhR family protein [Chloroflexi bacterium]|nr:YdhR family protein [Chloroflexota bacterium]
MVGLLSVLRPKAPIDWGWVKSAFRERYPAFLEMPGLTTMIWYIDEDKGEFGSFYVFESRKALDDYLASDTWRSRIPQTFGAIPEARIFQVPQMIAKKVITRPP